MRNCLYMSVMSVWNGLKVVFTRNTENIDSNQVRDLMKANSEGFLGFFQIRILESRNVAVLKSTCRFSVKYSYVLIGYRFYVDITLAIGDCVYVFWPIGKDLLVSNFVLIGQGTQTQMQSPIVSMISNR